MGRDWAARRGLPGTVPTGKRSGPADVGARRPAVSLAGTGGSRGRWSRGSTWSSWKAFWSGGMHGTPPDAGPPPAAFRLAVLPDFVEEQWPSMDLCAEMLCAQLEQQWGPGRVRRYVPA